MARRPSRRDVSTGILILLLTGVLVSQTLQAVANHMPADKVVAASGEVMETGTTINTVVPGEQIATAPVELLEVSFRSSSPSDLMLQVTLECAIITEVLVPGDDDGGSSNSGEAEGRIKTWLTFDDNGTDPQEIIPINTFSANPQPSNPSAIGDDSDKVTFCNTANKITLTDAEENEGGQPGGDGNDELRNYLRLKHSNAFNWIYFNAGNGIHKVELWAQFIPGSSTSTGSSTSGYVGNRMIIIEPTKFPNDAFTSPAPPAP